MTDSPTGALSEREAMVAAFNKITGMRWQGDAVYQEALWAKAWCAALASRSTEPGGEVAQAEEGEALRAWSRARTEAGLCACSNCHAKEKNAPARLGCQGGQCGHASDCAVHNEPAEPAGPCDCGATHTHDIIRAWCASCGMPKPSNGDCIALAAALASTSPPISASKEAATCPHCGKPLIDCKCWGEVQKVYKDWSRTRLDVHDDRFAMIAIDNILTKGATSPAPAQAPEPSSAVKASGLETAWQEWSAGTDLRDADRSNFEAGYHAAKSEPRAPVLTALSRDDQRLRLWQAIQAIRFGNKWDDKLIVEELHKAGFVIAALAAASQPPATKGTT